MRVKEKVEQGRYEFVVPLDFVILEALPNQGELLGGLIPLGRTVPDVVEQVLGGALDSPGVSARLRSLEAAGYTNSVKLGKGDRGWQRTPQGVQALAEWKSNSNQEEK